MKYAVYGAGSLGLVFSAYLACHNEKFTLIDRNIKSVEVIKNRGIKIVGQINLVANVDVVLETEVKEKYDLIFLFSKQIDNLNTIKKVANFLTPNGVICTMQNGLPEEEVAFVIGQDRTYGAAVSWGATRLDYGVSELTSEPNRDTLTFSLGSLVGVEDDTLKSIKRILEIMGNVEVEKNFIGARFTKLLVNAAFSGMSTVCGATFGEVAKNKKSRKIIQRIIKECIDVARANDIKIEPIQGKDVVKLLDYHNAFKKWFGYLIIPLAIKKHSALKASMLQDILKGHPCEIDAINAVVCRLGAKKQVLTPFNDKVVEIIKAEEKGQIKPSFANTNLFKDLF